MSFRTAALRSLNRWQSIAREPPLTGKKSFRQYADAYFQPVYRTSWKARIGYSLTGAVSFVALAGALNHWIPEWRRRQDWNSNVITASSTLPLSKAPKPLHDVTDQNMSEARKELIGIVGPDGIDDTPSNLQSRSRTEWSPSPGSTCAALIVFPHNTRDVSEVMKVCHRRRIPATGFSGGTSLDGALASTRGGICIDFSRMNRILKVHVQDMDVVVQPSVGWEDLNARLAELDLFFPPDPGPGAQIGGMIGTGCSGTNAYRYGTMKDWVISTTVVLADGTIVKTRNRPRKSTAGYDLTRLIVGSSGTLGLVTEAVLKVTSKPENEQVAVITFPSNATAVSTVIDVVQKGIMLAAVELLDDNSIRAVNEGGYSNKEWKETPTLFVKFSGTKNAVREQVDVMKALAEKHDRESYESSSDPEQIAALWTARKTALWSLIAQKRDPDDKFVSTDVAVPISRLAEIMEEANSKVKVAGLLGSTLGHAGDGNFHTSILYAQKDKVTVDKIIADIQRRGIEMEGTVTGEHGIGLALRDILKVELGDGAVDMMRQIKFALDPLCLLNCDKVVRVEPDDGQQEAT
ncbi:MAG: D-lactate ferricytochrome c oxidoreductase [Alectoria sarmentosa]|nr:MAG: D-lactate ferricytochrome c oxidoreductase [Alectoria sarmentosa]